MECPICGRRLTYKGARCNYCDFREKHGKNKKNFTSSFHERKLPQLKDRRRIEKEGNKDNTWEELKRELEREFEKEAEKPLVDNKKEIKTIEDRSERNSKREIHDRDLLKPEDWLLEQEKRGRENIYKEVEPEEKLNLGVMLFIIFIIISFITELFT